MDASAPDEAFPREPVSAEIGKIFSSPAFTENTETKLREDYLFKRVEELEALVRILETGKYQWQSTFDAICDPVVIIAQDYRMVRINHAGADTAKIPIREVVGQLCYESLAGRTAPCPNCPLAKTLAEGVSGSTRLDTFPKNNRVYEVNAYPLAHEGGGYPQAVMHYRDVTEEETLYKKLLQSEKMAALGTLAGGVAHEINNPLGGILAFAQLIGRSLPGDSAIREDLREIEQSALRCKEIVSDLLEFSRMPADESASVDVNAVILKLIPLVKLKLDGTATFIETSLADGLPLATGRPHKLEQVLLNLMTNGLQAMREKGGRLAMRTWIEEAVDDGASKSWVMVEVSDEGEGIAQASLDKIFDPFFTTKKQGEGTGLGLSISYGIVKECGGTIEVKSILGEGTQMTIRLPVYGEV